MAARKKKAPVFPAWHPEFRIADDLPDVKAVRTDFLVNIGAVTVALVLLFWLGYREAAISSLDSDWKAVSETRERLEDENRAAVALNARFMKSKAVADDVARFYDAPVDVPDFFADVGEVRPEDIAFEEIAFREEDTVVDKKPTRQYRLVFRGQTRSLEAIDGFKDDLAALPYLRGIIAEINEGANPRNPALNTFGFSIEVLLNASEKKGEK